MRGPDENTQEIAQRLREGGMAVEVVNGELISPTECAASVTRTSIDSLVPEFVR